MVFDRRVKIPVISNNILEYYEVLSLRDPVLHGQVDTESNGQI